MFTRATKFVVINVGQRNCLASESSIKNTRALVLAAERSRVPGILNPIVEQTAETLVSNHATTSEQNGLVDSTMKKNKMSKHDATNDDTTLTSGTVGKESQEIHNSCESSLPQGLELPKSKAGEFLDIFRNVKAKAEPITESKRQLRTFLASNFSHDIGISKQKTETWRSKKESVQILGEMGPSSHSRSCYSRAELEALEYCEVLDIMDTGFYGLITHYSSPSARPRSKNIKVKNQKENKMDGRRREPKLAKDTAAGRRGAQMCSAMIQDGSVLNQGTRKRRRRVQGTYNRIRRSKSVPTDHEKFHHYLTEERTSKIAKIHAKKSLGVKHRCGCNKRSQKRFSQKCNTARENWTIPPVFSDRKPILLHNFDTGRKKSNHKLSARVPNVSSFSRGTFSTVKRGVTQSRRRGQTPSVRTVNSTHEENPNFNQKRKSKGSRRYSVTARLIPRHQPSAWRKSIRCLPVWVSQSVDNIDDQHFGPDDSLSRSAIHESLSTETGSSAIQRSFSITCSSALSTAMSRITQNGGGTYQSDSTKMSCASLVFSGSAVFTESLQGARRCSDDAGRCCVIQKLQTSTSSLEIKQLELEKSVPISSTPLLKIPSLPSNNLHRRVYNIEYASGEPKNCGKNSECKKVKKFRPGIRKMRNKSLSRSGISEKTKGNKKCTGMKSAEAHTTRANRCPKF